MRKYSVYVGNGLMGTAPVEVAGENHIVDIDKSLSIICDDDQVAVFAANHWRYFTFEKQESDDAQ